MPREAGLAPAAWIVSLVVAGLPLSRAFACVTPFAGPAALAALTLRDRDAVALVALAWLGNQAIGFGLMHCPWTGSTLGWGAAIGAAALLGWAAARGILRAAAGLPGPMRAGSALLGATLAYELALLACTSVLPSRPGAFAPAVVLRVLAVDSVALALLLAARRAAGATGSQAPVARLGSRPIPGQDGSPA